MAVYALVVGINQYLGNVPNLGGCHYDASRMANVLQQRFQVKSEQLKLLLSEAATKVAIIAGFQQHLAKAKAGDTAVFYYSGHGSQEQMPAQWWASEADRQNETLVCHDSRLGVGDLADKELRFLIAELDAKSIKVVVIMDCCHSGDGTRDAGLIESCLDDQTMVNVRLAKSFSQRRTVDNYIFSETAKREGWLSDLNDMPEGEHILLSGCQDSELSKELNINGQRQGAFTHFLCTTLENTQLSLSYRNLLRKVKLQVRNLVDKQNPTCMAFKGANPDELFLGNSIQPLRLVVFTKEKQWWLDAGMIQGMQRGDEISIYVNSADEAKSEALLTSQLAEVQAEKSRLAIPNDKKALLDDKTTYYAKILQRFVPKLAVAFEGDQAGINLLKAECEKIVNDETTDLLDIVDINQCDYRILASDQAYGLLRADQAHFMFERIMDYHADSAVQILQQAQHLARWHNKLALINQNSRIPDNAVELVVNYQGDEYIG
ncbi:MAG TPA: caspase family protein, partial [Thiothrix sp.]|nr:caspase family protein [Thiothrix sp.]